MTVVSKVKHYARAVWTLTKRDTRPTADKIYKTRKDTNRGKKNSPLIVLKKLNPTMGHNSLSPRLSNNGVKTNLSISLAQTINTT